MPNSQALHEGDLDPDPLAQFHAWFDAAAQAEIPLPEAAAVATATADGRPSVRMVLIKVVDERGFVFFTNYASRKGQELIANPHAALLFHWVALERQIRIEGPVRRATRDESVAYAQSRSRDSQLSALASAQSQPVADRGQLERRVDQLAAQYADQPVPVSEDWGGFRLAPERFEFWQGGPARLHDRFIYTPSGEGRWTITRLAP